MRPEGWGGAPGRAVSGAAASKQGAARAEVERGAGEWWPLGVALPLGLADGSKERNPRI